MSFYSTYDLVALVRDDGIKTFNAREIATGRSVLVHLFARPESLEMQALLKKVTKLPAEAQAQIFARGEHEGTPYVVTGPISAYPGFREWLVNQTSAVERVPASQPAVPASPDIPTPVAPDDPFAALFKRPAAPQPAPAPQPSHGPVQASTRDFRHLIETPTTTKPAMQSTTPPPAPGSPSSASASGPDGTRIMSTGDFLQSFESQPLPPPSPAASESSKQDSGMRDAGTETTPREFTRMFEAPRMPGTPTVPAEPQAGDFTRQFLSRPAAAKPEPPPLPQAARAPREPGEFTRMFQAGAKPAEPFPPPPAAAPPPQAAPTSPAEEAGQFTRMFQAPTAAGSPPPRQAVPAAPTQEAGDVTRVFQVGPKLPEQFAPSAPSPPQAASTSPAQEAGQFTRMFQAPTVAGSPPPPLAPQTAPPQKAGEFTRMFTAPTPTQPPQPASTFGGPAPMSSTPAAPPKSTKPGEFTRLFDSPLHPATLKPAPGSADPFAGKANMPPPQAAPVGEYTSMFGPGGTPQQVAPIGPPTPRPPAGAGATNVFATPQPPQSYGPSEFTTMMSKPSAGILAEAAAAPAPVKNGFFKTYLPVILVFAGLIVVLIVILIFFAVRKQ